MNLIFCEKDKLLVLLVVMVVWGCLECGVKLNYFEVIVLIIDFVVEGVCDGCSVVDLMEVGVIVVICEMCMDGIFEMIYDVQVEVIFFDGIKLVIVYYFI